MGSSSVEDRVRAIAERTAIDHGLELVHLEVAGPDNKPIVRIFIDKPNGVTHQDCSEVSLHVGKFVEASFNARRRNFQRVRGVDEILDVENGADV